MHTHACMCEDLALCGDGMRCNLSLLAYVEPFSLAAESAGRTKTLIPRVILEEGAERSYPTVVWVCVGMGVNLGEGGGGEIFVGECGGELECVVVGVCVGVGVGVGMRVPMVSGTSVGQLVPFCGVNVASGVTGMATGGGFWVLVIWSSHTSPWTEMSLNSLRPRSER